MICVKSCLWLVSLMLLETVKIPRSIVIRNCFDDTGFLATQFLFKRTLQNRLTGHCSPVILWFFNRVRVNLKGRNANQLEAALPNLIKTKCKHRGFEFGGPKHWNVSKTSKMQCQCCFIWFGVCYPFMLSGSLEKLHKRLTVCFHGCLHAK